MIRNQLAGSLIVTKDGRQLLESYLSDPSHQDPLRSILIKMCCSISADYGDGSLSAVVIMSQVLRYLTTSKLAEHRILFLNALETIIYTVEMQKDYIAEYMIDKSVWSTCDESESEDDCQDLSDHVRGLWGSILYPATNSATAASILSLLVR